MNDVDTDGKITVRAMAKWLAELPEEFQNVEVETVVGQFPVPLKRVVAYRLKDDRSAGVAVNGMGTHLPFDDTIKWEHRLT